jgi:hypothetical protein
MKDPKGHGSNGKGGYPPKGGFRYPGDPERKMTAPIKGHGKSRGGSYPNIDNNLKRPGVHVGYADGPWNITKLGAGYLATHQKTGDSFRGDSLGHVSNQLAAHELASGPKSAPAPIHDAWSETPGGDR